MVFNTGAALGCDRFSCSIEGKDGTYGYKITQMYGVCWMYPNQRCIRCCGDCRRMNVWRRMIRLMQAGTADIIRSQRKAWHS